MNARTFISLMFFISVVATGLLVFASPRRQAAQKNECPAGTRCPVDNKVQSSDMMILETVSRHLLSSLQ